MKTEHISATYLTDAKAKTERRFRNILANSGKVMESGEVRDIKNLYVMGHDGELYRIADLATDPDKQIEQYSVKAQADHGEVVDGELIPSIEKQFGSCKVWLEEDGLHARMYFADNDTLADHAWAISEDASYSIGMEWYPDGYFGAGLEIDEPIGILREISMVITGNDPRAKTIDHKPTNATGPEGREDAADGTQSTTKENDMAQKIADNLTPDESAALKRELAEELSTIVDKFTTDAPESETEPTADSLEETENKEENVAETTTAAAEQKTDSLKSPVIIIKDKAVAQPKTVKQNDWLHSEAGHMAFADTLRKVGRFGAEFNAAWRQVASQHMSLDGITGLPNPAPVEEYFVNTLEKSDGILGFFQFIPAKSFRVHALASESRAQGHRKGDTKVNQEVTDTIRDALVKMVYKRLDLDATELYENPWLIDFRSQELVEAILAEIERAACIGDGRTDPEVGQPDYRMFDGTRGFFSILADATANSGIGTALASSYASEAGENLYDAVVSAKGQIKTEGRQILIAKSGIITDLFKAKVNGNYLIQPGGSAEDTLRVARVFTPTWMENASVDAILLVDKAYKTGGERNIRVRADFDTSTNQDILLDETPRWGTLGEEKSAVAITLTGASE